MRILFLTQILPYPPDAGPRVKTWNVLRYLVQRGHAVTLVSYMRQEEECFREAVEREGIELFGVPLRRSRLKDGLYWLYSCLIGLPFLVTRDNLPEMRVLVEKLLRENSFQAIHADQFTMTQFVPINNPAHKYLTVFDAHNATYSIMERMQKTAAWFFRPILGLEAAKIKRYEAALVRNFDYTLTVTPQDRQLFVNACRPGDIAQFSQQRIQVIPIAVDTQAIKPVSRDTRSHNIIALGTLHYPPNADGIRWFMQEVFPLVRSKIADASLTVIGKNPPQDFLKLQDLSNGAILVTGYVPDLEPLLRQAAMMVVPVRAGSGMRVRILEAFGRGIPVVTTPVGLEGIAARPGEEVMVEESADGFADAVVHLLKDTQLQSRLANQGRCLVEQIYDWRVVLKKLDGIYGTA